MRVKAFILATVLISISTSAFGQSKEEMEPAAVPFKFDRQIFAKVTVERFEKVTARDETVRAGFPIDLPAHTCYYLEDKKEFPAFEKGARYFSPSYSRIWFIPTSDKSEDEFALSYPTLVNAVEKLRKLLKSRTTDLDQYENLIDLPYNNSGWSVTARVKYLDYAGISGVAFLTQYTQELFPNPLNNEELTFNFQGLTKDKKFYVAARFAISHPDLPKGIDFTDEEIQADTFEAKTHADTIRAVSNYLKKEEQKLEGFKEKDFYPSIPTLEMLIASIGSGNE